MKYLGFLALIFIISQASAQESVVGFPAMRLNANAYSHTGFTLSKFDLSKFTKDAKVISVQTNDAFFHKTYYVNKHGETLSYGFRPAPYYSPNDNLVLITGASTNQKDSFNPYGADDMTSMIILSTVNSFISRIKIGKR